MLMPQNSALSPLSTPPHTHAYAQVLSAFPYATTCTLIHLLVASVFMSSLWLLRYVGGREGGGEVHSFHT